MQVAIAGTLAVRTVSLGPAQVALIHACVRWSAVFSLGSRPGPHKREDWVSVVTSVVALGTFLGL